MTITVDLNSDLGEGYGVWNLGDDAAMLDIVSSANVACGFHAGDPAGIERTVLAAVERGVRIGAQVSYPDLRGFGRRAMEVPARELRADVLYQIGAVSAFCRAAGSEVSYVKPHGALYNRVCDDEEQAGAVVSALLAWSDPLPLLILPGSVAARLASDASVPVIHEGFADRAYTPAGRLLPRDQPGAVLTDPDQIAARAVRMVREQVVLAVDGAEVPAPIDSLCVHGDTPGAVRIAGAIKAALAGAGTTVAASSPGA